MHSIREVGGTDDVKHGIDLLRVCLIKFGALSNSYLILTMMSGLL